MFDSRVPLSADGAVNPSGCASRDVALADGRSIDRNGEGGHSRGEVIDSGDECERRALAVRFGKASGGGANETGGRGCRRLAHLRPDAIDRDEGVRMQYERCQQGQSGGAERAVGCECAQSLVQVRAVGASTPRARHETIADVSHAAATFSGVQGTTAFQAVVLWQT